MTVEDDIRSKSNATIVVGLQRLSKDITYFKNVWTRSIFLDEAAKRLNHFDMQDREIGS